jgi:hypothetical protein
LSYNLPERAIVTIEQIINRYPHIVPPHQRTPAQQARFEQLELAQRDNASPAWEFDVQAVMLFDEPRNAMRAIQVIVDVVNGAVGGNVFQQPFDAPPGSAPPPQSVDVLAANPDLNYFGSFPYARLTCGSFQVALQAIFFANTGRKLKLKRFGKPERKIVCRERAREKTKC